ncbi:TPA: hypothetical protein EYP12_08610, partial [Candidatus Bipolaricaulota bacterium]|nr:hypothetical protein [Candidatus Bipolaricaulota bacterium]
MSKDLKSPLNPEKVRNKGREQLEWRRRWRWCFWPTPSDFWSERRSEIDRMYGEGGVGGEEKGEGTALVPAPILEL